MEWGYALVMWIYDAAKHVGFSNASGASLAAYMRSANNVPVPLGRTWTNPGPKSAAAIKQPYARVMQWNGKAFVPLPVGPDKDGWVSGLK